MNRPTIALACILKNEINNLPQFFESIEGCFDAIYMTDTGSTDGSVEWLRNRGNVRLSHFQWCNDFSKARQFAFDQVQTEDYIMWMDLDDVLGGRNEFIHWRDHSMANHDFWVATYHYASDSNGRPNCSFARERVVSRKHQFRWNYFVHEGLTPTSAYPTTIEYAPSWSVVHKRTPDDEKKDKRRNLKIFDAHKSNLDGRMQYYLGKEHFENQQPLEAFTWLLKAVSDEGTEAHDRILALQYLAMSCMFLHQFEKAQDFAFKGIQLAPLRAEFYIVVADCFLRMNKLTEAKPFYHAAAGCPFVNNNAIVGAMNAHEDSYKHYPLIQLAKLSHNQGDFETAKKYVDRAMALGPHLETMQLNEEIVKLSQMNSAPFIATRTNTDDIVISGWPQGPYTWDEEVYATNGIGGSETAAIEMARHMAELSGRKVIVFNNRDNEKTFGNVTYLPASKATDYFSNKRPAVNINWRHCTRMTDAPSYIWCHDLGYEGLRNLKNYDKAFALSEFHKNHLIDRWGVPEDKIIVTRNGLDPARFETDSNFTKDPHRVIWSSSPDRGLWHALQIMDRVEWPDKSFHVYYGFDGMLKHGLQTEVERLMREMQSRPWVQYHGNVNQKDLITEMRKAAVWLYPTSFLETFCITALEAICCGVRPVVRRYGALPDTLGGSAEWMDHRIWDAETYYEYALAVENHLPQPIPDPMQFSWRSIASEWLQIFGISK